jgi:hypothetical protein
MGKDIIEDTQDRIIVREWSGETTTWRRLAPDLYEIAEPRSVPMERAG